MSANPFSLTLTPEGYQQSADLIHMQRHLSDLDGHFANQDAVRAMLANSDPLVYEYWEREYEGEGQAISFGMTRIFPGQVGKEYFKTKGHFHADDQGDEIHLTLEGEGLLLLSDRDGVCQTMEMKPGKVNYIPGHLAHRTINIGLQPLVFAGFWPPKILHDYETIARGGFPKLVVAGENGVELVDNPTWGS
jgi:glucose-6-phosphate isomerase